MWETYLNFVEQRHLVWERRRAGQPGPWTDEPIVASRKFTNVFRVLDYGSQYLMTDLLYPEASPRDTLMRAFLYRHTGRVEPWQYLDVMMGRPTVEDLDEVLRLWQEYRGDFRMVSSQSNTAGGGQVERRTFSQPVFTGAYLVFPQSQEPGTDKLESIVRLTQRLFTPGGPDDIMPDWMAAKSHAERFAVLRRNKGVADFMSMQILTDWGYSPHGGDTENEFVVAGPGAVKGARHLQSAWTSTQTIKAARDILVTDYLDTRLGGRPPSLMDVQNTLCEFSKYVRYLDKPATKPYVPAHPGPLPEPFIPPHWSA